MKTVIGCRTRSIALLTLVVHAWINLVFAPWHQLVEHQLPAKAATKLRIVTTSERRCGCGHTHCKLPRKATSDSKSVPPREPITPDDHDECSVCQILAQPQTQLQTPIPFTTAERVEFVFQVSAIQPLLGSVIAEVSRGPPTV